MDFNLPHELSDFLKNLDRFIDQEIKPLQAKDDNERFFDHRREWARTDFDNGGLPRPEWEELLVECKKLADKAGIKIPEAGPGLPFDGQGDIDHGGAQLSPAAA